jgi:hypothetical protein
MLSNLNSFAENYISVRLLAGELFVNKWCVWQKAFSAWAITKKTPDSPHESNVFSTGHFSVYERSRLHKLFGNQAVHVRVNEKLRTRDFVSRFSPVLLLPEQGLNRSVC